MKKTFIGILLLVTLLTFGACRYEETYETLTITVESKTKVIDTEGDYPLYYVVSKEGVTYKISYPQWNQIRVGEKIEIRVKVRKHRI